MVDVEPLARGLLTLLRVVTFGLTLGITLISFQAYQKQRSQRLQYAFLGFAFVSMGVAISSVITQFGAGSDDSVVIFFQIVETIPFIIGFSMLYISLYR